MEFLILKLLILNPIIDDISGLLITPDNQILVEILKSKRQSLSRVRLIQFKTLSNGPRKGLWTYLHYRFF